MKFFGYASIETDSRRRRGSPRAGIAQCPRTPPGPTYDSSVLQKTEEGRSFRALLDEDYQDAIVHLAWAVDRNTKDRVLLSASVELLPTEVPVPVLLGERHTTISSRFFLFTREVAVSARRALDWFDAAALGRALRPIDDRTFPHNIAADAPRFVIMPLDREPPASALLTSTLKVPFSPDWQTAPRVSHLIPESSPFASWTADEREAALSWLGDELHADLRTFPEYVGAIHLLAPNPVFRELFIRHEQEADGRSKLLVAFTRRAGRPVSGLYLIVEEERSTGIGVLACVPVQSEVVEIPLPYFPGPIRERVVDPERGLLYDGPFGVFGVGFNLSVELASSVRRVDPGGGSAAYEVPLVGGFETGSRVGPKPIGGFAGTRLARAATDRRRRERGTSEQQWFREAAPDAVEVLRALVVKAKGEVFVCDPYFEAGDLLKVILAIADPRTSVRVLAGARHLKEGNGTVGDALEAALAEARAAPPVSPIEIRVMRGKDPPVHDRFVDLGDVMWMLGASLNHFGDRGTLMVRVPDPEPVRADLEEIWKESPALATWLTGRRNGAPP